MTKVYTFCCNELSRIRNVTSKWLTRITSISLTDILIRLIYVFVFSWWYWNYKLKPVYRVIRRLKRKIRKLLRWTWNKITIILSPISALLYSLTDYRWLTFYIIVLAKLFVDLCEREDKRKRYRNRYKKNNDDNKNGDEETEDEEEDQDDE